MEVSRNVKTLINNFKLYLDCTIEPQSIPNIEFKWYLDCTNETQSISDIESVLDSITVVDKDNHWEYRLKSVIFDGKERKFYLESVRTIVGAFGKQEHFHEYVNFGDFDDHYILYEEWKKTQFPRVVAHMAHDINNDLKEIIESEIIAGHTVATTFWDTELVWIFDDSKKLKIKLIRSALPAAEIHYNGEHYFSYIKTENGDVTTDRIGGCMTNDALSPLTVEVLFNISDTIRKFLKEM